MNIISESVQENLRERGSKFLGFLFPCNSLSSFDIHLQEIKTLHPTASHHCYAYRLNPVNLQEFSSDDGEPNGSAGLPILNQLKSVNLVNVGLVVVRYFGGTKLGKTGLIETYGKSARLSIAVSNPRPIRLVVPIEICFQYPQQSIINKLKSTFQLSEMNAEYLENVKISVACSSDLHLEFVNELEKLAHLEITFKKFAPTFLPIS